MGRLPAIVGGGPAAPGWRKRGKPRVPSVRDSRVAEAIGMLQGPWSMLTRALFFGFSTSSTKVLRKSIAAKWEVFIIFGNNCKFYQDAKCLKKNAFCDLKCEKDGIEDGFVPLRRSLDAEELGQDNSDYSDLDKLPPLRLPGTATKNL